MVMRVDKLQASLPAPNRADPKPAALLELLGGKYGEMSTLGNYAPEEMFEIAEKLYKASRNRHRWPATAPDVFRFASAVKTDRPAFGIYASQGQTCSVTRRVDSA